VSILVITETGDLAADLIVLELQRRQVPFRRLNLDQFPAELAITYDVTGSFVIFETATERYSASDVRAAWYRRLPHAFHPDPYVDQEARAFLTGLWQETRWTWVNAPASVALSCDKLWQLRMASRLGLEVPATIVSNQLSEVRSALGDRQVVAKTIGGAAVDRSGTRQHLYAQLLPLAQVQTAEVRAAPCIFQEPAKPGTDVRITIAGSQAFGIDIQAPDEVLDWRAAPPETVRYRPCELPGSIIARCQALCEAAGLTYAAFDFIRQPGNRYVFLEVNPSGQWGWLERATGQPITAAIVDALCRPLDAA
jgi:glutathione synthase/RimK-type ligase-like ATP-grasp enzyme